MRCQGIRGAITVEDNTRPALLEATRELLREVTRLNGLRVEDIACAIFSTTPDLNAEFPAVAAREMGWDRVALLDSHEMDVPGALPRCLRVLILVNTERGPNEMVHVYLRGAANLRPSLARGKEKP